MTDAAAAAEPDSPAGETPPPGKKKPRLRRTRAIVAWILVVLAALLVPLSVITAWAVRLTTNTDKYVETLAPLASDPVITNYIALRATDRLFEAVPVQEKVQTALPKPAQFVAAPVTQQLKGFVENELKKVLDSTWFHNLWNELNRRSHQQVVEVLTGKGTPKLQKANEVLLNVTPVVGQAVKQLDARGIHVFDSAQARLEHAQGVTVKLASSQQISKVRGLFHRLVDLTWKVPLVALLIIIVAGLIAVDHRKTLLRIAIGAAIVTLVFLGALQLGKGFFVDHARPRIDPALATAAFNIIVRFLTNDLRWTLLICLIVAVILWFIGPSSWALWIRAQLARGGRWVWRHIREFWDGEQRAKASKRTVATAAWISEHAAALRIAGAVVAGAVVIFGGNLSISSVWNTVLGLAAYLIVLQVVVVWARRITASASGADRGGTPSGPPPATESVAASESTATAGRSKRSEGSASSASGAA
jgi:hypothetical protein